MWGFLDVFLVIRVTQSTKLFIEGINIRTDFLYQKEKILRFNVFF
jgi:hypothetical protein